jgi:uncharacterized protein YydD (DUF2326 family)
MIRLKCLRSEPEIFDSVEFTSGVNLITGERSGNTKSEKKTNGVGKSLLINFIDFCLLADYHKNRIFKVPEDVLSPSTNIILETQCGENSVFIHRSRKEHDTPSIYVNGEKTRFSCIDDARKFLYKLIFGKEEIYSLREMIRAFKRVERDGYGKIENPDGGNFTNITPYLYMFGLSIELYTSLVKKVDELVSAYKYSTELKKDIERCGIPIKEVNAYANDLKAQLTTLNTALDELSQTEVYDTISDDISDLDNQIEKRSLELTRIKDELQKIAKVPEHQSIEKDELHSVFNDLKNGMGDLIVKEIDEIEKFQNIIDNFKTEVISKRRDKLLDQKNVVENSIKHLSDEYKKKTSVLDKDGSLRSFKVSLHERELKNQEYTKVSFLSEQYQTQEKEKLSKKGERDTALNSVRENRDSRETIISIFQKCIIDIHHHLYGNSHASFDIEIKEAKLYKQKTFINFHLETDDSGSARTEHEKILIFDLALMFCSETRQKHAGILIHDGAFEGVNEDTKFQILNWLHSKQEEDESFQYIATINRDSFELLEKEKNFSFDLNDYVGKRNYTKQNRFLKKKYAETSSN